MPNITTKHLNASLLARKLSKRQRALLDSYLRESSRDRRLQFFSDLLEALQDKSAKETAEPFADPILCLWRIWNEVRQVSFSRADLERKSRRMDDPGVTWKGPSYGGLGQKAMASRLCVYWHGHPREYQIHRAVHSKILDRSREACERLEQ